MFVDALVSMQIEDELGSDRILAQGNGAAIDLQMHRFHIKQNDKRGVVLTSPQHPIIHRNSFHFLMWPEEAD